MILFESLFGQKEAQIKATCVLVPFLMKGILQDFGIKNFHEAKPYSSGNSEHFTLIHTRVGAPFVGDAVLYLRNTPCKNLILFGTCGLVQKTARLGIGSLVAPEKIYSFESFSQILNKGCTNAPVSSVDSRLMTTLQACAQPYPFSIVTGATFASLQLEETYRQDLIAKRVDAVDMEGSAFLNAAAYLHRKAVALFVVSDILAEQHAFAALNPSEQTLLQKGTESAVRLIRDFTSSLAP